MNYDGLEAKFSGNVEEVLKSLNEFVEKNIPSMSLAKNLTLNFSTAELVMKFQEFVKITSEGPRVWSQDKNLSDKEIVALQLVAERIEFETSDGGSKLVTLARLQESTSMNPKSLSSRLSELSKSGYVVRETQGSETGFRISTLGIDWLANVLSKKKH